MAWEPVSQQIVDAGNKRTVTAEEDLRLVSEVLAKDRKATAEFIERHADKVHAYVQNRLLPRADLVDDVVQEVFLAAWENLDRFQGRSSLQTWLLGIARHKVEDHYRRLLSSAVTLNDDWDAPAPKSTQPLEEYLDEVRSQERVHQILSGLPESYGLVLLWRYWEKRSAREIAERIGKTEKAVERLLARARAQFKRSWQDEQ